MHRAKYVYTDVNHAMDLSGKIFWRFQYTVGHVPDIRVTASLS